MNRAVNWGLISLVSWISAVALWAPAGMQKVYENFDGPYYLVVAKTWYNQMAISQQFSFPIPTEYYPAHYPLFPLLINAVSAIPIVSAPQAMVIVNLLSTTICAIVIYEIFKKQKWGNALVIALVWLFWWPRMWVVRSVGSPETLFILFVVLSLYAFQLKRYWYAGILGGLAVLTKSPGVLLGVSYGLWVIWEFLKTKKIHWQTYPILIIPFSLLALFTFYQMQTGDFFAYFNSGDNIHLQATPFQVFDSSQPWVGNWWLEGVIWIYVVSAFGVLLAIRKNLTWGLFGVVFLASLIFVSHRDIERYSLPLVPVVLLGLSDLFNRREVKTILALAVIPLYFYSLNFLLHNTVAIADWAPFL